MDTGPYGAIPILIFSESPDKIPAGISADAVNVWNGMQEDLKKLSTRSAESLPKTAATTFILTAMS